METSEYGIIGFYVIFMLLLNFFVIGFSGSIVNGTDYLTAQQKTTANSSWFDSLAWVLSANVPSSSNAFWTVIAIRGVYLFIVIPYSVIFAFMIANYIRGR